MNEYKPRYFLEELQDHPVSKMVKVIYDLGANVYEEKEKMDRLYPWATDIILFEPMPEQVAGPLAQHAAADARIKVFPYAISGFDGESDFYVLGPTDCNFSSLTDMTEAAHKISPTIQHTDTIRVPVRKLSGIIKEFDLPYPDFMHIDIHGAEYDMFTDMVDNCLEALLNVKMIFCEVCSIEFYKGGHTLDEIKKVLEPYFNFVHWNEEGGWARIGNAFWTRRGVV